MPALNFDHIPPLHIPFRFFNTAPWMAVLAALLMLLDVNDTSFASQWNPDLLAMTHLLTLGFMAMTMIGALFQVLPVISGQTMPLTAWIATIVHLELLAGTLLLASAFKTGQSVLFVYSVVLLLSGFLVFLLALGYRLVKRISGGDSINAVRFAALSLLVTITLGATRALGYHFPELYLDSAYVTPVHIVWGFGGWLALLVMGVSFQVIPMFHVTPGFSVRLTKWLPVTVFVSLLTLSVATYLPLRSLMLLVLCLSLLVYAGYAIWLLSKRRRKLPDNTVNFWRLGLGCGVVAVLLFMVRYFDEASGFQSLVLHYQTINVLIGIWVILGFACSVIIGMLHKIIPFLIYMHLQRQCDGDYVAVSSLPNMLDIIPVTRGRIQVRLHMVTLVLLSVAVPYSSLGAVALLVMMLEFAYLGYTVNRATWLYRHFSRKIL